MIRTEIKKAHKLHSCWTKSTDTFFEEEEINKPDSPFQIKNENIDVLIQCQRQ